MNDRLRNLRMSKRMTQEELAEKLNVSRQTIAKWENGETVPDMIKCSELARIFELQIEDIAHVFLDGDDQQNYRPKDKYVFGVSRIVQNKIIIPDEAMKVFGLENNDELIVLGDIKQGIALLPKKEYQEFINTIMSFDTLGDESNENSN